MKFVATKKGMTNFFTTLFFCCFWIRDPGWVKTRIRDKHPESATLYFCEHSDIFFGKNYFNLQKFYRFSCQNDQIRIRYNYSGSGLKIKSRIRIHNTAVGNFTANLNKFNNGTYSFAYMRKNLT